MRRFSVSSHPPGSTCHRVSNRITTTKRRRRRRRQRVRKAASLPAVRKSRLSLRVCWPAAADQRSDSVAHPIMKDQRPTDRGGETLTPCAPNSHAHTSEGQLYCSYSLKTSRRRQSRMKFVYCCVMYKCNDSEVQSDFFFKLQNTDTQVMPISKILSWQNFSLWKKIYFF